MPNAKLTMRIPNRLPRWADALWLALLSAYILAGAAIVPYHGDESTLVFMGRDYHYLFVQGDLSEVLYDKTKSRGRVEQRLRLENGTISKTIYGWLAWNLGYGLDDFNQPWNWGEDYESNLRSNRAPSEQLLGVARMASALQLALAVLAFFKFVEITLNRPTAYLASALLALHPNVLINGRRAMMEGSHLLGLMLLLLASAWLLRERRWYAYPLFGAGMGFAVAAKHPNALIAALAFLAILIATLRDARPGEKRGVSGGKKWISFLSLPIAAALVFFLLNPAWWSAPFELPALIIELRADLLRAQVGWFGGYNTFEDGIFGFFRFVFAAKHQYFEVASWAEYDAITAQIARYESSGMAGILIGGTNLFGIVCLALAAFGALNLARNSKVSSDIRILLLTWIGGSALVTLAVTPLPWARYYLPLAPALVILVSHSVFILISAMRNRFNSRADGINILD